MKKLSNTEAGFKKSVAYKNKRIVCLVLSLHGFSTIHIGKICKKGNGGILQNECSYNKVEKVHDGMHGLTLSVLVPILQIFRQLLL